MGYRIVYGQPLNNSVSCGKKPMRFQMIVSVCALVFSMIVKCFWPEGSILLKEYIAPEELTRTQLAVDVLLSDLRDGAELSDALMAFCTDILDNETAP